MPIEIPQGSGRAKLRGVLGALSKAAGTRIEFATVTAPAPSVRIKIDNMPIDLDAADLVICEHLAEHTRTAKISGGAPVEIEYEAALVAGDRVIVAEMPGGQYYVVLDRIGGGNSGV